MRIVLEYLHDVPVGTREVQAVHGADPPVAARVLGKRGDFGRTDGTGLSAERQLTNRLDAGSSTFAPPPKVPIQIGRCDFPRCSCDAGRAGRVRIACLHWNRSMRPDVVSFFRPPVIVPIHNVPR